jgi:hypothetical protein
MSLLTIALFSSVASAQPLAWAWSQGTVVHYHAEVTRERDDGDWHQARRNIEARAQQTNLVVDLSCQVAEVLNKGWSMECAIDGAQVSGVALASGEQERLNLIFEEYELLLNDSSAIFEMSATGRIKSFDIRTFEPANEREAQVVDAMRMLMVVPFGQLELELPKAGDDKGRAWKQGGSPLVTQLRTSYGTAGSVVIKHRVEPGEGPLVTVVTEGRGTLAYGLALESDGTKTIAVDLAGAATFDPQAGVLASRETMVVGRFTAGASYSGPADHYREVASIQRIDVLPEPPAEPAPEPEPEPAPEPEPEAPQDTPEPASEPPAE